MVTPGAVRRSNPHRAAGAVRLGASVEAAAAVVIAVHGRHQSPAHLVEHLCERVASRLGAAAGEVAWILPAAADGSWYPNGFLAPVHDNQPGLDGALAVLGDLDAELAGRDPASVLWCGFSQGACVVAEYVARHPTVGDDDRGGVAVLTGAMVGPPDRPLMVDGRLDDVPCYFGVGEGDAWIPAWRSRETADAFRAAGADVMFEVFADNEHEIREAEVAAVAGLVHDVLG